jgi:DNA protecting protein DprA
LFNVDSLLAQIKNDDEALIIISALGNSLACWPFIKNMGGPLVALQSDLFINMLIKKVQKHPNLASHWAKIRNNLDNFYETQGFLCTPANANNKNIKFFKLPEAPLVFFGRYNSELLHKGPHVAIVGARDACDRGLYWSKTLAQKLASDGINIISGGAHGIDREAHKGALDSGGLTCVISGFCCNFNTKPTLFGGAYDYRHVAIVHPFGPFFIQAKYMFVERNKYVAALADALIVVQGKEGSGTLHTVKFAESLQVPIYAVPGALDNPLSYVPNKLLQKQRAQALVDFEQISEALVTNAPKAPKKPKKVEEPCLPELLMLIKAHGNALSMNEILAFSGRDFSALQKELLVYELSGQIIKRGAQFVLTGR